MIITGTGFLLHNKTFRVFVSESDGGKDISTQVYEQDHNSFDSEGQSERDKEQKGHNFGNIGGKHVSDTLFEVVENESTFFDA